MNEVIQIDNERYELIPKTCPRCDGSGKEMGLLTACYECAGNTVNLFISSLSYQAQVLNIPLFSKWATRDHKEGHACAIHAAAAIASAADDEISKLKARVEQLEGRLAGVGEGER